MKILFILLLLVNTTTWSQSSSSLVSMNGIGEIKLGMKIAEVEKLTGKTFKLNNLLKKDDWNRDTISFTYKEIHYQAILDKDFINDKSDDIIVYELRSNGSGLKSKSGIGIGDDKLKIVTTYPDYMLQIQPEYEKDYITKSKTRSSVWLFGDEGRVIIFYLLNGKVTGFSVMYNEGC